MRLLIVTQKVDEEDDILGFFHGWIIEFAKQVEQVIVVCLEEGKHSLPENVNVRTAASSAGAAWMMVKMRYDYDAVFFHEQGLPMFACLPFAFLLHKRTGAWSDSMNAFRMTGKMKAVTGPGVDTDVFRPATGRMPKRIFDIVSVGDMDHPNDFETIIAAAKTLHGWGKKFSVRVFGGAHTASENARLARLLAVVEENDLTEHIEFQGGVPNAELSIYVRGSDLFVGVNASDSLSRSSLEACACGVPILTPSRTVAAALGGYKEALQFRAGDSQELAGKISWAMGLSQRERNMLGRDLRDMILKRYDLRGFISRILAEYRKV